MKKIFCMLIVVIISILCVNVNASVSGRSVMFKLTNTSYLTGVNKFNGNNNIIEVTYKNNLEDLSLEQLNDILGQKINTSNEVLTVYGEVVITMDPVSGSKYDSLINKTKLFRSNGDGSYTNNINSVISNPDVSTKTNMRSSVYPVMAYIFYRPTVDDEWTHEAGLNMEDEKIEEYLARLLDIDLDSDPNGVIDVYEDLYYIAPINTGNYYINEYGFYDVSSTEPTLHSGVYDNTELKYLNKERLVIKYLGESSEAAFYEVNDDTRDYSFYICFAIGCLSIAILSYFKKEQIKKWLS